MKRNNFPTARWISGHLGQLRLAAAGALMLPAIWLMLAGTAAWAQAPATPRNRATASVESDTWVRRDRARVDLDRPAPVLDCNRNAVDDRLDLAGIVARGPVRVGRLPGNVAAADLNGDGRTDLVVANEGGTTVSVLWHRFGRRFEAAPAIEVGQMPSCIAVGDLDGDGDADLVVGHAGVVLTVTLLWNDGAGSFRREELAMGGDPTPLSSPRCVAVADVDGDGRLDILATSGAGSLDRRLSFFRNRGGAFDAAVHKPMPSDTPHGLAVADFDGDGRLDMAVTGGTSDNRVAVVFNAGADVAFQDWPVSPFEDVGLGGTAIRAADLDGDGDIDLALVNFDSGTVAVLLNDPSRGRLRQFGPATRYTVGARPLSIGIADLDDDGRPDIVVPIDRDNRVAVLHNRGAGTFDDATDLPVGNGPRGIWAGNLDSDRHAELVVSHGGDDTVWVLHMKAQPAAPDCNGNRIPDACDITAGTSADHNRDRVPDECTPHLAPARRRAR